MGHKDSEKEVIMGDCSFYIEIKVTIFKLATDETRIFTDNLKNLCLSVFNPWLNSSFGFKKCYHNNEPSR
jgi:hypothetical protein